MSTPSWGIEPVPERLRVLGLLDTFLLWTNLGISILVLVSAAYLGLPLKQALFAIVIGAVLGNAMLASAGLIDCRAERMLVDTCSELSSTRRAARAWNTCWWARSAKSRIASSTGGVRMAAEIASLTTGRAADTKLEERASRSDAWSAM